MSKLNLSRFKLSTILLSEKNIFIIILLNTFVIIVQEFGYKEYWLVVLDYLITIVFVLEIIFKIKKYGLKTFFRSNWNKIDFIVVVLAIPSIINLFYPNSMDNYSVFLVIRAFKIMKFIRIVKFFPDISKIAKGVKKGIRSSYSVFFALLIFIVIISLINCSLFGNAAPGFFNNPLNSFFSMFRLFTVEGWYEIPAAVVDGSNISFYSHWVINLYFSILLIIGGVIGLSLINSVFVDAMVSDLNDDTLGEFNKLNDRINDLEHKIDALLDDKKSTD